MLEIGLGFEAMDREAGTSARIDPFDPLGWIDDSALRWIDEVELGSLVAALSATTDDETELDDRVRGCVESGRVRVVLHRAPAALVWPIARPLEN